MNHPIDNSVVKLVLKSVQDGDLEEIQSNIKFKKWNQSPKLKEIQSIHQQKTKNLIPLIIQI